MYKVIFPLISLILTAACGSSVPAEGLVFDWIKQITSR